MMHYAKNFDSVPKEYEPRKSIYSIKTALVDELEHSPFITDRAVVYKVRNQDIYFVDCIIDVYHLVLKIKNRCKM